MKHILFALLCLCAMVSWAQKSKSREEQVHATHILFYDGKTKAEARSEAILLAQTEAIKDKFGTNIIGSEIIIDRTVNGKEKSNFYSYGMAELRGKWIKDTREPEIRFGYDEQREMSWCQAEVWGIARKTRNTDDIDLQVKLLRNATMDNTATYEFDEGDRLFINVKSPVNGFIAIYCDDLQTNTAFRLLPGPSYGENRAVPIKAGQNYVFLDNDDDAALFACGNGETNVEINRFFVLFSPNNFYLPNDNETTSGKKLSGYQLQEHNIPEGATWVENIPSRKLNETMAKLRNNDDDIVILPIDVAIRK